MGNTEKRNFFHFFMQKKDENIFFTKKKLYLCNAFEPWAMV